MSNELNKSIRSELQALAVSLAAAAMAELSGLAQSGARPLDVARDELREAAMLVLKRAGDSLTEHERVAQTLLTSVYSLLSPPRARQPLWP